MTDDQSSLLNPVPAGGDWRDTAVIGGEGEDDGTLASGFLEAADVLTEHWRQHRPNDLLAIPILANYRHGIELALKHEIREAAACVRRDGDQDPEFLPEVLDKWLASTHSIGRLAERLGSHLSRLDLGTENRLPEDTLEILDGLHALDGSGQELRYSAVKTGSGKNLKLVPARPDHKQFDLPTVAAALHNAGILVLYGVSGVLDQYREWQQWMRQEIGPEY
jgi:hypothetical protein